MRNFFVDISSLEVERMTLPPQESKHACRVLRMRDGDTLAILNGRGEVLEGTIEEANPKACKIVKQQYSYHAPDTHHTHIAIAPTKSNDRFEWFLEKATELGVHEITPLLCANSERKKIKWERYQKVLIAAMKQSQRFYLPQLNPLTTFKDFISTVDGGLIAHCEDGPKNSLEEALHTDHPLILIGPEGDFSAEEIHWATEKSFKSITLGKTRLRTETAGIMACAITKLKFEKANE